MRKRHLNICRLSPMKVILFIVLALYVISMMLPLLWGLFTSLKSQSEFRADVLAPPKGWPWEWQWSNFPYVLSNFRVEVTNLDGEMLYVGMSGQIINTLLYAGVGGFLATFIPCLTAYLTAKLPCKLSSAVNIIVVVTMILPIVGAYPSEIRLLRAMNLYDNIVGSWLQKANFLGLYYLVFFAAFRGLDKAYTEAAYMDGARETRVMFRIAFPLVKTVFLTVFLIKFIEFWNDYQTPLLYLPSHPTLAYGIFDLSNSRQSGMSTVPMRMTGCIILVVPILTLFLIFKNKLMGNISMGGVKG